MMFTKIMAIAVIFSMVAIPVMAELNDYQRGVQDALKSGFAMGLAYQQAVDGKINIEQYNQDADKFNKGVQAIFSGNQTAIANLMLPHITSTSSQLTPYQVGTPKIIHAVDASFNQTNRTIIGPQGQRIFDMPVEHYCTDNPNAPGCDLSNTPIANAPLGSA